MKPSMKLVLSKNLESNLKAMGRALTRKTLTPILRENLEPMADDMRAHAARGTGEMAESVRVTNRLSKTQRAKLERIARIEMYVGPGPLPQVIQEEFGNFRQAPRPFIRPAFDNHADRAIRGIAEDGVKAILGAVKKD